MVDLAVADVPLPCAGIGIFIEGCGEGSLPCAGIVIDGDWSIGTGAATELRFGTVARARLVGVVLRAR
jgi:hypothetical protein